MTEMILTLFLSHTDQITKNDNVADFIQQFGPQKSILY